MRVVHFSTIHSAADTRIYHKECRTLSAGGYQVHLFAPSPRGRDRSRVRVHTLERPQHAWRVLRVLRRLAAIHRRAGSLRAQVYHFHDPELIPIGLLLKARGAKVVYDVHEDAPREAFTVHASWLRGFAYSWIWRIYEAVAKLVLDGFVCATPILFRKFPARRSVTVCNYPLPEELEEARRRSQVHPYAERENRIVYAGIITAGRGIFEMVEAMSLLPPHQEARLRLLGEFSPAGLRDRLERRPGWERVDFVGWQDRAGVLQHLCSARVGIVVIHRRPEYEESYPVKLFEYMAAGLPVVASDFPLWRDFVASTGCGFLVDPSRPDQIAARIQWLLCHPGEARRMGERGRQAAWDRFNWHAEGRKLLDFYARLKGD